MSEKELIFCNKSKFCGEYDTVVVGGGIAGVSAAIAASRHGAKTLLVEKGFMLGGLATAGLIVWYLPLCDGHGTQLSYGLSEELLRLSVSKGAQAEYPSAWLDGNDANERKKQRFAARFDANAFAILLEQLARKEKVDILYGTTVCSVNKNAEENRIKALQFYNISGFGYVTAKSFIDATGDASVCDMAGEDTSVCVDKNKIAAWYFECLGGEYKLNCLGARDSIDEDEGKEVLGLFTGVDAKELTNVTFKAHDTLLTEFLSKGKIDERHNLATIATIPQVRMTRKLVGAKNISVSDDGKTVTDSVGMFGSWRKRGPAFELPYGCLYGKKIKNLAVAGRCVSVDDDIWDLTRVIPVCAVSGEAAGIASALSDDFSEIDVAELQNEIVKVGGKIHLI